MQQPLLLDTRFEQFLQELPADSQTFDCHGSKLDPHGGGKPGYVNIIPPPLIQFVMCSIP